MVLHNFYKLILVLPLSLFSNANETVNDCYLSDNFSATLPTYMFDE